MSMCKVAGCERPVKGRGWCNAHYSRWHRDGDPQPGKPLRPKRDPVCTVDGCDKSHKARGWCTAHYRRWQEHGDVLAKKPIEKQVKHKYPTRKGNSHPPRYLAWNNVLQRCTNPSNPVYHHYGGRGIGVCERWAKGEGDSSGYDCFWEDMGPRPEGHTLDRINPNEDYTPENCQWAPDCVQAVNQRPVLKTLAWALESGLTLERIVSDGGVDTSLLQS